MVPQSIVERFLKAVYSKSLKGSVDKKLWETTYKEIFNEFEAGFGKSLTSVMYNTPDWEYLQQIKFNTAVFSAFKQNKQIQDAAAMLLKEDGTARSWQEFRDKALEVDDTYNKRWLQTEFNQAHQAAKQASRWRSFEKTADLYPNLKYVAVLDERTRESHRELNGTILPITDPFWDKYAPPNGWGCRCSLRPTDKDPTQVPAQLPDVPGGMDINPGKQAKVFSDNHTYVKGSIDKAGELMEFVSSQIRDIPSLRMSYDEYNSFAGVKKLFFDGNSGGFVTASKSIKKTELGANLKPARIHALSGSQVELTQGISSKTDGVLNGFKACNDVESIGSKLLEANSQAKEIVSKIDVTLTLSDDKDLDAVRDAIAGDWQSADMLDRLYVIIGNERFGPYSGEEILSLNFL